MLQGIAKGVLSNYTAFNVSFNMDHLLTLSINELKFSPESGK